MSETAQVQTAGQFRRALEDGDHMQLWRLWSHVMPHLPQPKTPREVEIMMHRARTEAASIAFDRRAYSHAWLLDQGLESGLPDELRPKAERICPTFAKAVGVSVRFSKTMKRLFPGLEREIEGAMSDAVNELHGDGVDLENRPLVHQRIFEARERTLTQLIGRPALPRAK